MKYKNSYMVNTSRAGLADKALATDYCQLTKIPYTELKELVCSNNLITEIINIPDTLTYLNCENNKIEILTNLPNGITGLKVITY